MSVEFTGSELDFQVENQVLYFKSGEDFVASELVCSLVRTDNGVELGTCGNRYVPIQNKTIFDFVSALFNGNTSIGEIKSFKEGSINLLFSNPIQKFETQISGNVSIEKRIYVQFQHNSGFSIKFGIEDSINGGKFKFPKPMKEKISHDNLHVLKLENLKELFSNLEKESERRNFFYQELVLEKIENPIEIDLFLSSVLELKDSTFEDLPTRTKNRWEDFNSIVQEELKSNNNYLGLMLGAVAYANKLSSKNNNETFDLYFSSQNGILERAVSFLERRLGRSKAS